MSELYLSLKVKFTVTYKIFLLVLVASLSVNAVSAQTIAGWDFYAASTPVTYAAATFDVNLVSTSGANNITRGAGAAASAGAQSFRTVGFKNDGISITNTDYFQVTLTAAAGYATSLSTIDAKFNGTATYYASPGVTSQYAYSLDGTTFILIGSPITSTAVNTTPAPQVVLSGVSALQNVAAGTTITLRYYASGQTTTGGWGYYSSAPGVNGLAIGGTVTPLAVSPPIVSPGSPVGFTNNPFSYSISATNTPTAYAIASGTLPAGLTLNTITGAISGTPTAAGSSSVTVTATNSAGTSSAVTISFTINPGTSPTDYFRSVSPGGNWNNVSSWESSPTGGAPWSTPTNPPTSAANTITIQASHTIIVNSSISLDQTIINGTLDVQTGAVLNINDGTASDISISAGGLLQVSASSAASYTSMFLKSPATASIDVATGGRILIINPTSVPATIQTFATDVNNTWATGSVFEYNCPGSTIGSAGNTFFPNSAAGVIPVLRITAMTGTPGGAANTTINGILEVNSSFTFVGAGAKIFRDGITGTATLTLSSAITGGASITGATAVLGSTGTLGLVLQRSLTISNGITVPTGAAVNVTQTGSSTLAKSAGSFLVNGIIDISDVTISNSSGDVTVNGTLKTANTTGLYGTGASIVSGTLALGASGTIEYNAAGNQSITNTFPAANYNNITISNGGTKTLATTSVVTPISGTVTVGTGATLDVSNITFGSSGTNLTLITTGKFINAGGGVKPDMGGTYTLGTGSTVEFGGTSATDIRLKNYYNVNVTGTNVSTSTNTASITLQSGGTFTVAAGAKFKTRSAAGFSGAATASVNNINTPNVVLNSTSTIDYIEPIAQNITNQVPYGNLTISATTGLKTASAGITNILGDLTKSGAATFANNGGTFSFDGTAATTQTYSAADSIDLYKVIINNSNGGLTTASALGIQKLLSFGAGAKLILGAGSISLRSSASATAAVDQLGTASVTYSGNGRFHIERYINYLRKWQLLSVPATEDVLAAPTFRSAWMEGSVAPNDNLSPGYGMQITDPSGTLSGFDASSNSASVKSYLPLTDTYLGILTPATPMFVQSGYFAFVRGDRLSLGSPATTTNITRLRTTGKIQTGNITVNDLTAISGKYQVIGNPYPSAVNLKTIGFSNITSSAGRPNVYVWDPTLYGNYGYGKFILLSYDGANYIADNALGLYSTTAVTNFIQSGQAFFVQSSGGSGSVSFAETDKYTGSADVNFTPGNMQLLRTNLYTLNNGTDANGADGAAILFGDQFSNTADENDAVKMLNTNDNLALKTDGKLFGIERRRTIIANDTLHLNISAMRVMKYRFVIAGTNLDAPGRSAFLNDKFTNAVTPLSLTGNTSYDFSVTGNSASAAADRFMIVFKQLPAPKFVSINAVSNANAKSVSLSWKVADENNVSAYKILRSGNGRDFEEMSTNVSVQNTHADAAYGSVDAQPLTGDNYYRVKMITTAGAIIYSDIVNTNKFSDAEYVAVSPNPVTDKIIHLQMSNQLAGKYTLQVINEAGQSIYKGSLTISGHLELKTISLNKASSPGIYRLIITAETGAEIIRQVFVQ